LYPREYKIITFKGEKIQGTFREHKIIIFKEKINFRNIK
jgi:hypothetical protein